MSLRAAALAFPFLAVTAISAVAQTPSDPSTQVFSGEVSPGAWLRIRTLKGDIEVRESSGRNVVVSARRHYGSRGTEEITFDVVRDGSNVTVCAVWRQTRRCDADGYDSRSDNDRNLGSVLLTVSLPRGVKLVAATGNGDVDIRNAGAEVQARSGNGEVSVLRAGGRVSASSGNGDITVDAARGDVKAHSGNGDIDVSTSLGPVSATTGNGRIEVEMSSLAGSDNMEFRTGNGSIIASFPADFSGVIEANVPVSGFTTDFPMELPARWSSRHIEGKIGNGGRRVRFSTGNGRVAIRKAR